VEIKMAGTIQNKAEALPGAVARGIAGLIREMLPPVAFFFIALMLIYTALKLLALQYDVHFIAFARAAIGAVILGKIVLLMEMAERKRKTSNYPRAIVVAYRTVIYALAVIVFEFGERFVRAWYKTGSLSEGAALVKANTHLDHFLALLILGSMVLAAYLVLEEISHAMGEGELTRLFFKRRESA
jgi:fumarate reductase subunit D